MEIWEKSKDTRGTQLVFCDLSTPKKPFSDYEYGKEFDVYNELKYKLVKFGIHEKEIAFIHDAKTDKEKQALFNAVNNGEVRVFIGSTEKCGAGMNVQNKLIALHHLDTPYRPSDMEQREGRIIRQGNENSTVQIFTYVMERTFDSYSYQILENKQRFISQINRGDLTVRVAEDIDEATLSYAQIKAITSGNPKILRKMQLDEDVAKLKILEGEYLRNLYRLQDLAKIELPEKIRQQELYLSRVRSDMELIKEKRTDEFSMSVNGKVYTDKKECADALWNAANGEVDKPFGEFCGFTLRMKPSNFLFSDRALYLSANGQYEIDFGTSATGNLTRLENFITSFPEREARVLAQLDKLKKDLQVAEEQAQVPFEKADELSELQKEQLALNEELSLEKREEIITDSDEETGSGGSEETDDDDIDNMEEIMTDDVNFMGVPEKDSYASRTRHGYEVKATFDNGERVFAIIERGQADDHDYIIGCGYDKRDGDWAQGVYGFSSYEEAEKYMQQEYPDFKKQVQLIKPTDYYQAVKENVKAEYEAFYNEELKKPPEELIARDNYRIRFYNELSVFLEDHASENLSERDVQALYEDSPHILSLLYEYFLDNEYASINTYEETKELITNYNDKYFAEIVKDRDVYKSPPTYLPIYYESIGYAREHGELDKYKASRLENLNCKAEIESSIRENYDGAHLNTDCIDGLVEKFGYERVMFICAKTINDHDYDGRYSRENKAWAKTIPMPSENIMTEVVVSTHPAIFDGFTRSLIKKYQESLIGKKEEKEMPEQVKENKKTWLTFKVSANAAIRTYDNSTFMRMPQDSEDYKDFTYNLFNNRMKEATMDEEIKKEPCFEVRIASDEQIKIVNRDGEEKYIPAEEFIKLVGGKRAESYRREGSEKIEFEIPKEAVVEEREKYFILSTPTNSKYKGRTFTLPSAALTATETGYNVSLFENFRANIRWGESDVKVSADELQKLCGSTSGSDYVRAPSQMEEYREQEGNVVFELNQRAVIAEYDKSILVKMPKGEFSGYTCYIPKKYAVLEEGEKPQFTLPEDYKILLKDRLNSRETSLSASEFASVHRDKTERDYTGFFVKPSETSVRALEATEANLRENLPEEMLNRPNWVAVRTRINPKTNRLDKFLIDVHTDDFAKSDDPSTWADFDNACEYAKNNGCTALAYALDGKDNIVCLDVDDCIDEKDVCSDTAFDCMENTHGTYCERSMSGKGLHFLGKSDGIRGYKVYSRDGEMELYQRGQFITLTGDVNGGNEIKSFDTPQMRLFIEERFDKREEVKGVGKGVEGLSQMSDREVLDKAMGAYNGETFKAYYEGKDLKENRSNSDMAFMNMLAFWCRHDVDQMQRIFATSGLYRPEKSADYYEHTARKAVKATPMLTLKKAPSAPKPVNSGGNSKA